VFFYHDHIARKITTNTTSVSEGYMKRIKKKCDQLIN